MNDTPKTDDAFYKIDRNQWVVDADFARELERENNRLRDFVKYTKDHARAGLDSGGNIYIQLNLINSAAIEALK